MNKAEVKFIISYLKKAIFDLERANDLDDEAVSKEIIDYLKQALFYYQNKLKKEEK